MKQLVLSDFYFGKIDAKNELIQDSQDEKKKFINSYIVPDNINPIEYIRGMKYFVKGCKGTGKTALLRYISIFAEEKFNAKTSFILFKTEIDQDERKKFSRAANTSLVEKNGFESSDIDFEIVWRWFFHRNIVENVKRNQGIFARDDNWERYEKCITSIKLSDEKSGIKRLIPKITKSNVELEGNIELLKGKLGLDFEWSDENKHFVKFIETVKKTL